MKSVYIRILSLLLFCIMGIAACSTSPEGRSGSEEKQGPDGLLFLNIRYMRDTLLQKESFELVNFIRTEGSLKREARTELQGGYLLCSFLDENKKAVSKLVVADPLILDLEYLDSSDNFQRKKIVKNEGNLSLRVSFSPLMRYIRIDRIHNDLRLSPIGMAEIGD